MSSMRAFKEAQAVFAALAERADQPTDLWDTAEHQQWLELVETLGRILPALQHDHINHLAEDALPEELGGTLSHVLADRLRIRRSEATRRIAEAADLAPRRALTGQALPPRLEHTAAGQQTGAISGEHVKVIRGFFTRLPHFIDEPTRADAEQQLASVAAAYRPEELQRFADHLDLVLNPDGTFSDEDRARRRGLSVGPQGPRRDEPALGLAGPGAARRAGRRLGQVGRPGHVQPRR